MAEQKITAADVLCGAFPSYDDDSAWQQAIDEGRLLCVTDMRDGSRTLQIFPTVEAAEQELRTRPSQRVTSLTLNEEGKRALTKAWTK